MANFTLNALGQTASANSAPPDRPAFASGKIVTDATAIVAAEYLAINVGFTPRYFRLENVTTNITVEWFEGMTEDTCVKTAAAGTRTLETTNKGVSLATASSATAAATDAAARTILVSQNATLGVITASDTLYWIARG